MNTEFARQQMIKQQVRAWDVLDSDVLEVFSEVHREIFVPSQYASLAFADTEIPLGYGQSMLTPTIAGRFLQSLSPVGASSVLEVGTGSGFLTACLATLAVHVTSLEIHADLLSQAERNLAESGIENVDLLQMNAMRELPDGQFDVIAVTGSLQMMDQRLLDALAPGGRLMVVIGDAPIMRAEVIAKTADGELEYKSPFETLLAPLVDGRDPAAFVF